MKKQIGQVIVEFALILPLFLLMIFGLIYSGMLFHDYSTLSNVARSATREAAISSTTTAEADDQIIKYYYDNGKFTNGLITSLYVPNNTAPFTIVRSDGGKNIVTTIKMTLNTRMPLLDMVLPENFDITYHMRKDS